VNALLFDLALKSLLLTICGLGATLSSVAAPRNPGTMMPYAHAGGLWPLPVVSC